VNKQAKAREKARAARRRDKNQRRLERKRQSRKRPTLVAVERNGGEVEWFRRDAHPFKLNKV
jgi:hypothetical protein